MSEKNKKILLSGIKPTGLLHIGNYFGAMRQFVDLQEKFDSYVFIADYHALTTLQNAKELSENIIDIALDYLTVGLDPKKVTLFKQSDVPEVAELGWIFNCITTMPYLARAHAFKSAIDKYTDARPAQRFLSSKFEQLPEINVGIFDYPMLMSADILIQDADVVPVGADQKQHVEFARDTAEKFNRVFNSEVFKLPEPIILENVKVVLGIDGQKMSKSYGNVIPLFASDEEIKKLVMSIVTDSSGEVPKNVYAIHELFRDKESLNALYEEKKGKYKDLKEALVADMVAFIAPLRLKREVLAKDREAVIQIIKEGGEKARARALAKMKVVREKIGVEI